MKYRTREFIYLFENCSRVYNTQMALGYIGRSTTYVLQANRH